LTLDKWEQEAFDILSALGNQKVNSIFEVQYNADAPNAAKRPSSKSDRTEKERWITAKYVAKHYVCNPEQMENYGSPVIKRRFWQACSQKNLFAALQAIAMGATVDFENPDNQLQQTPLLSAIEANDSMMIQFLLSWNADIKATDTAGYGVLHYAVRAANMKLVEALLKRNIKYDLKAKDGKVCLFMLIFE
jgi:hypothetical protein